MYIRVIKKIYIDIDEFIKTENITIDNIEKKVSNYYSLLIQCGYYDVLDFSSLCQEIYKKLNENT